MRSFITRGGAFMGSGAAGLSQDAVAKLLGKPTGDDLREAEKERVRREFQGEQERIAKFAQQRQEQERGEEMLSEKEMEQAKRELSSVAQKVFEAVPIGEFWDKTKIAGELKRKQIGVDFHAMSGCLATLVRTKIVDEKDGTFRRTRVRPTPAAATPIKEESVATEKKLATEKPADKEPAERLLDVAIRLGEVQEKLCALSTTMNGLMEDMQDVAAAMTQRLSASTEELQMLRQLQAIFKNLGRVNQ